MCIFTFLCLHWLLENSKANLWCKCSQGGRRQHAFCVLISSLLCEPMDYSPPGLSVSGIPQQEYWIAIPFSRRSSLPRDQTWVSCIAGRFFIVWATTNAQPHPWFHLIFPVLFPLFFLPHLPTLLFLLFVSFSILVNCCIIPWNKRQCKIANTWGLIWNLSMWNCMPVNTHQNHPYFEDKMGTPDPFKLINLVPKQRHTYILQNKIQDRHDVTHPGYQTKPRDRAVLTVRVLSRLRTQGSSDRGVYSSGKRDFGKNARHQCQNQAVSPGSRWDQTVYWANVIFPH